MGNKPPEAAHPVPKLQAGSTAPKLRAAEIAAPKPKVVEKALGETPAKEISLSRSKKMDAPAQGVTTPAAAVPQATINFPYGFKPQQYFTPAQRAVQPTTAPKARVEHVGNVGSEGKVTPIFKTKKELKEQPWTIRPGQEYKEKIVGKAQKTGGRTLDTQTGEHATRVYREAIDMAKSGKYEKVYLNRAYKTATGEASYRRPDIIGKRNDGKIDVVEVMSKTDKEAVLRSRNEEILEQYFPDKGWDVDVKFPTKIEGPQ